MRSESFDLYAEVLFAYTVTLMDIYSLGRMTKDYNNNVIVVAGMAHIRKYREFFLTNGWTSKWVGKNVNKKCITVPDLGVGKKSGKLGKTKTKPGKTKTKPGKTKTKPGKTKTKPGKTKTKPGKTKKKKRVSKYKKRKSI
jgi:hypothetical protein